MNLEENLFTTTFPFDQKSRLFGLIIVILSILTITPFPSLHKFLLEVPNYFYTPNSYSVAYYTIPQIPSSKFLILWEILNLILLFLILISKISKKIIFATILCVNLTLYFSLYYSFGKIDHNYANIIFLPFACHALLKKQLWSFNTVVFILIFCFLSSGLFKLSDFRYLSLEHHRVFNFINNISFGSWINSVHNSSLSIFILECLDYGVLFFEIGMALLVIMRKKFLYLLIFFACMFHCIVDSLMSVSFRGLHFVYIYLIATAFYHYTPALKTILENFLNSIKQKKGEIVLISIFLFQCWNIINSTIQDITFSKLGFFLFYIILGITSLYIFIKSIKKQFQ